MKPKISIKKAERKEDLLALLSEDFTWETSGRFDVVRNENQLVLVESQLDQPVLRGESKFYHQEIKKYAEYVDQPDSLTLVALVDDMAVGYVSAFVEEWKEGKVINAEGVLVSKAHRGKGIAKALVKELMERAKAIPECRGIMIEMDTEKYEANKLLLSMGFTFAGTRLYIYSSKDPLLGSKEAVYFYYKIDR